MTGRRLAVAVGVAALVLMTVPSVAQAPLAVSGAWVREPVGSRPTTSAYAIVENSGSAELRIVGVTADLAGSVEMHEMTRAGDVMKMAPLQGVTVPPGGRVEFKPGGAHLMLFALKRPLKDGDTVTFTFTTSAGSRATAIAPVKKGQVPQ